MEPPNEGGINAWDLKMGLLEEFQFVEENELVPIYVNVDGNSIIVELVNPQL